MEKCICCCLSHQIQPHISLELFWLVNAAWSADFSPDSEHLFTGGRVIMDYGLYGILVKNILMLDLFDLCLLQMLTDGLEWCGLLWCFYQTLILTAPIHCRASIAETLMQRHISTNLMKKQTHGKSQLLWKVKAWCWDPTGILKLLGI